MHGDVGAGGSGVGPRTADGAWADIETRDRSGALLVRRDRHDPAAGAEIGDAAALGQSRLFHDVDEQLGVFLRGINTFGERWDIQVGVGGCHIGLSTVFAYASNVDVINARYRCP